MSASWPRAGPGRSRCSPMPACPSCAAATRTTRCRPAELAMWLERFVAEDGVNIVGGCCGTGAEHIAAARLRCCGGSPRTASARGRRRGSAASSRRLASLFSAVPLRQENAYFAIGERCNANGSKQFRELQAGRRLGRLRRHGPRAGARGQQRRSISAPPSSVATRSCEMVEVREPDARPGRRARS